jgi:biopolymer transport protein ExbD
MSRSSNPFEDAEDPELSIAPLIDVAFLLLIYFLVTTTLQKQEADLSLALPGMTSIESEPVKVDQMLIQVTVDGTILVNREVAESNALSRELPILTDRLKRYAASAKIAGSEAMVIIDCEGEAQQQRFVDVLNVCAKAGLKHVTLTQ